MLLRLSRTLLRSTLLRVWTALKRYARMRHRRTSNVYDLYVASCYGRHELRAHYTIDSVAVDNININITDVMAFSARTTIMPPKIIKTRNRNSNCSGNSVT